MPTIHEVLSSLGNNEARHIVSLSGGKDSTALAVYMRETYPQIPVEYVFCDTGAELPETYAYLERVEALLGRKITRLSALDLPEVKARRKPGRIAFDIVLNEVYGGFLPNPRARWCTRMLKIKPFERYVGPGRAYSYIGIRWDEDREGYRPSKPPVISQQPNIIPVYPFKDDRLTYTDIEQLLQESGLGLPSYYQWRSRSGCYFCFYQQIAEWQGLKEKHPDLFSRAKAYEEDPDNKGYRWVERHSLGDLEKLQRRRELVRPDEAEGCAVCHL